MDLSSLCVIPDKLCWNVYIDAVILDTDGNALDAIALGARAALKTAG